MLIAEIQSTVEWGSICFKGSTFQSMRNKIVYSSNINPTFLEYN